MCVFQTFTFYDNDVSMIPRSVLNPLIGFNAILELSQLSDAEEKFEFEQ